MTLQEKTYFHDCDLCGLPVSTENNACPQHRMWRAEEIIQELLEVAKGFAIWAGIQGMPDDHPLWEKYDAAVSKAGGKP